ncbi:MAG: hypothetical protein U0O22_07935 [Acutalibacteraceae bacterium]
MTDNNKRLGFFKLYFENFGSMLVGNLLFAVPMIISIGIIYGLALLLNQSQNILFLALAIIPAYPFYSGITQITKDILKTQGNISAVHSFKKGLKNNFKFFALYGVLIYFAFIISYFSIALYLELATTSWVFYIPLFMTIVVALFLLFSSFSIPILTVTLELKLKHYFKNSALIAFGELPMNFYVMVTTLALLCGCLSISLFTGNFIANICIFILATILILPTGVSYCAVYRLYPKIEKLFELDKEDEEEFPTMPVAVPTDDNGNPITSNNDDDQGYVFVNGMMIKKSQANSTEYISESD